MFEEAEFGQKFEQYKAIKQFIDFYAVDKYHSFKVISDSFLLMRLPLNDNGLTANCPPRNLS